MSKKSSRRKLRVTIPAINLGVLRGDNMEEPRSRLDRKREELEELELESDIVDTEAKITRRRKYLESGQDLPEQGSQKDSLADRLVEEVVIPIVNKTLQGGGRRDEDRDLVNRALSVADRAMGREPMVSGQKSIINEVFDGIARIRELTTDTRTEERLDEIQKNLGKIAEGGGKKDALDELDKVLGIIDKLEQRGLMKGKGDSSSSDALLEFKKWEKEFDRDQTTRNRAYDLRLRHQDKQHDLEMAKLGIQRERNELLEGLVGRIGETVADALMDENELEEEEKPRKLKPRKKTGILELDCPGCGEKLAIPPEGQTPGSKIECPKCGAISQVTEE